MENKDEPATNDNSKNPMGCTFHQRTFTISTGSIQLTIKCRLMFHLLLRKKLPVYLHEKRQNRIFGSWGKNDPDLKRDQVFRLGKTRRDFKA